MKVTEYSKCRSHETEAANALTRVVGAENVELDKIPLFRSAIEQGAQSFDDKTASEVPYIFGGMRYDGTLINSGTRINWHGTLKQASADLWDTEMNNPDNAPTLWQDIAYREGIKIIPATVTVTQAFEKGERGWWHDEVYESLIDANVYTPEQYPAGWALVN